MPSVASIFCNNFEAVEGDRIIKKSETHRQTWARSSLSYTVIWVVMNKLFNHSKPVSTSAKEDINSNSLKIIMRVNKATQVKCSARSSPGSVYDRQL